MEFACRECSANFTTKGNLARHVEAWHTNIIWRCHVCQDVFSTKAGLDRHSDKH